MTLATNVFNADEFDLLIEKLSKEKKFSDLIEKQTLNVIKSFDYVNKRDIKEEIDKIENMMLKLEMKIYVFIVKATLTTISILGSLNTLFYYLPTK